MLEFVVFQWEGLYSEVLGRELEKFSANGINVVYNYNGEIKVQQCPPNISLKRKIRYYQPGTWTGNRFIKWPSLLLHLAALMLNILRQTAVDRFVFMNADIIVWFGQIFKFLGRIKRTVAVIEDWSMPIPTLDLFGRFNIFKLRLNDRLLTYFDTTVVITQKEIFNRRNLYWQNKTLKNTVLFDKQMYRFFEPKKDMPHTRDQKVICFFATMRPYNGIEILFDLLPELNQEYGFSLKVISPPTAHYEAYQNLAREKNLNHLIDWRGFVANDSLSAEFDECFCGLNIQELEGNSQQLAVAGRLIGYLQYYLVPIVTRYSGVMVDLIAENSMGVICEPTRADMKRAIVEAYERRPHYLSQMDLYWKSNGDQRDVRIYLDPVIALR